MPWSCKRCTLDGERPSWWFSPSAYCQNWSCRLESGRSYLVEDGLGLTSVTGLLAVITTLTLGEQGGLSCLVFYIVSVCVGNGCKRGPLTGDLVLGVLLAVLALAVGSAGLGNVDLGYESQPLSLDFLFKQSFFATKYATRVSERCRREWQVGDMRRWRLMRTYGCPRKMATSASTMRAQLRLYHNCLVI